MTSTLSPHHFKRSLNRYHFPSSTIRTPRVFPHNVQSVPLSPSRLESPMFQERVSTLMQQGDTYAKQLDTERRRSIDLTTAIETLELEAFQARKTLYGTTNSQQCTATTELKSIGTLESRLDKVLIRYNEMCHSNKVLRTQIQTLRREKVQSDGVCAKLERETVQVRDECTQVIQATQAASDGRDRANEQSETLRYQIHEENNHFELEWYEKTKQLTADRNLMREYQRTARGTSPSVPRGNGLKLLTTPDLKLREETQQHETLLQAKATDLQVQSDTLHTLQTTLTIIKQKTGESDAQIVAAALVAADDKSFSLCNLINELHLEMKELESEVQRLEIAVANATQEHATGLADDATRHSRKQQVDEQIEMSRQKVIQLEKSQKEGAETLEMMRIGALGLFHKLQGPNDDALASQLVTHGTTDLNMTKLLGVIEQRIGELVDIHNIATNAPFAALGAQKPTQKTEVANSGVHSTRLSRNHERRRNVQMNALRRPTPPTVEDFEMDLDEPQDDVRPCRISEIHETMTGRCLRKYRAKK
ncbi:uncharacterized protein PHALS_09864 [Plasmopara halstedii]|uniref:ODAD1 central coiled coil region domain-containing protein n=1 Tax=Plasmopara halstedii TaxID=4781 RepID=A0A0P1AEW3_PLAHL|nr:uncharacterized protein PHALS_09864 [Plasmopara halstedii]CEG39626.1 hypothetical protein PHALS_09864 [Plasmopara halstedii]|eukprot:XP_024575995.1 hypothetical protein PHALS_09864 [Plasmopara halstedii]